jgi:hypothetical protein
MQRHADSFSFDMAKPILSKYIAPCDKIPEPIDLLMHILSLQKPTGGMMLDEETAQMLSLDLDDIRRAASKITVRLLPQEKWQPVDPMLLLSTAILLGVLESHFTKDRSKWVRVLAKSASWLHEIVDNGHPHINGLDFTTYTEQFVRRCIQLPWAK